MGYINIFVSNPARINIKDSQLVIKGQKTVLYPLEDINSVIIESMHTEISSYALSKIAENKGVVFFCNEKHLPAAVLTPYNTHCRRLKMLRLQLAMKVPAKKKIWKDIVAAKIRNQAKCLELCGVEDGKLAAIAARVKSGDANNCEAEAASYYFRRLYGSVFSRSSGSVINSALNYGYAILRGLIARTIVAHGLEPNFGIFHSSQLNEFNLADDFIEPFRPLIDMYCALQLDQGRQGLDTEIKLKLFNLVVNSDIKIGGEIHSVSNAVEKLVSSYVGSLGIENTEIFLPELLPLAVHRYE